MAKEVESRDLQECIKLVKEMTTIIDPTDDLLTITTAEQQMKANHAKSKRENDEAYANLKALSRVLEAARKSSSRPHNVPTPEQHAARLNELDATRISLVKAIRDAENTMASKEAELAVLKQTAREMEECDPARNHQREMNGTALRLKIFKDMGFDAIPDSDGKAAKMLIRAESGDVHCITRSDSQYYDAEQAWKLATS